MHQVAGRGSHILGMTGPDRHREQHHIAGREARHRHGAQQRPLPLRAFIVGRGLVERRQPVAQRDDPAHQVPRVGLARPPYQAQPPCGHVDPARHHAGQARQDGFDQPYAGRAVQPVDRQCQAAVAVRQGVHVGGEIETGRLGIGPNGAGGGIQHAAAVIGFQAQPAHGLKGRRAARAAETLRRARAQRLAAMAAGFYCATIRFDVL